MADKINKEPAERLAQSIGMPFLPKEGSSEDSGEWSFQFDPNSPGLLKIRVSIATLAPSRLELFSEMGKDEAKELAQWIYTVTSQMKSTDSG